MLIKRSLFVAALLCLSSQTAVATRSEIFETTRAWWISQDSTPQNSTTQLTTEVENALELCAKHGKKGAALARCERHTLSNFESSSTLTKPLPVGATDKSIDTI